MQALTHYNLLTARQTLACYRLTRDKLPKKNFTIHIRLDSKVYFTISNFGHKGTYGDILFSCRHYTEC